MQSLKDMVQEPSGTKSAIRQAMMSPAGMRLVWVVVEAEEDLRVYSKFMDFDTTVVKTSEGPDGKRSYANVEIIVKEIREEVAQAHIIGIRDADYSKYEDGFEVGENIFLTDRRDLEMMLLESDSVRQALDEWMNGFDEIFEKCVPICCHFGYLRIFNDVLGLSCRFHDNLRTSKFWDYTHQALQPDWKERCTAIFIGLAAGACTEEKLNSFIATKMLTEECVYDICRGHDMLHLLSLTMINVQVYSEENIMAKMISAYSLNDFKNTQLYNNIRLWQEAEGINALVA